MSRCDGAYLHHLNHGPTRAENEDEYRERHEALAADEAARAANPLPKPPPTRHPAIDKVACPVACGGCGALPGELCFPPDVENVHYVRAAAWARHPGS